MTLTTLLTQLEQGKISAGVAERQVLNIDNSEDKMNTPKNSILAADNLSEDKTPKQITSGLRTELSGYHGYYLTEENAIQAMRLYNKRHVAYLESKIEELEAHITDMQEQTD